MEAAIQIQGVNKTFGALKAVDDLDLTVPYGSICGFLGPNGAGKTTAIRMIMSIIFPDSGKISVLGKGSAIDSKDRIGYLPEERGVYRKMKAIDFIAYMGALKGMDTGAARKRGMQWLERLELDHAAKKKCEELSKGMQQKAQIAACLVHDPELVILDEPFSGLDPVNVRLLRNLIKDLNGDGLSFIFSTHVLHEAEELCDRIFMIHKGQKVIDDTLAGIRHQFDPRTLMVRFGDQNGADLSNLPGVSYVAPIKDEFEVHLKPDANPPELMKQILASGDVRKVELRQPTLDDVFITLVEGARVDEYGNLEVAHD